MSPKGIVRALLLLICIVVSVAGLVNVYGDNKDVESQAKALACGDKACGLTRMDRTPFSQTFELTSKSGTTVIRCVRSAVFFGEYACSR